MSKAYKLTIIRATLILFFIVVHSLYGDDIFTMPVIKNQWRQIANTPDLGKYNSDSQQPVDFAIWQARDGTWQLWSCIRFTNLPGHTRLFYRWQGDSLEDCNWTPEGIAMTSEPKYNEPLNGMQAPHVVKFNDTYWMAYGDWDYISVAKSKDGKNFKRYLHKNGLPRLFTEGAIVNTRDAMQIFTKNKWYCYYTAFAADHGYVYCRTSKNLLDYSDSTVVAYGGIAGNNKYSCECPFVVEPSPGSYFLFRTQIYGPGAKTTIYNSSNPLNFGIENDTYYVCQMNICAPEIIHYKNSYYVVALMPNLDGVRLAPLEWKKYSSRSLSFDDPVNRSKWKLISGNLHSVFTNSYRVFFNNKSSYFIATAETDVEKKLHDDSLTGQIISDELSLSQNEIVLFISGGKDKEKLYVAVENCLTGKEIARFTGDNTNLFKPVRLVSDELSAQKIRFRVVDISKKSWGHINLGGIYTCLPQKNELVNIKGFMQNVYF